MSIAEAPTDAEQSEQNPLELVGGFDAFQCTMREAIRSVALRKSLQDIEAIDEALSPEDKVDGLEQGLEGLVVGKCQNPLTDRNLEILETLLSYDFTRLGVIKPLLEPHLTQGSPGAPMGLFIDRENPRCMDRRSGEFITRGMGVLRASDEEIDRRKAAVREQALQTVSIVAAQ